MVFQTTVISRLIAAAIILKLTGKTGKTLDRLCEWMNEWMNEWALFLLKYNKFQQL